MNNTVPETNAATITTQAKTTTTVQLTPVSLTSVLTLAPREKCVHVEDRAGVLLNIQELTSELGTVNGAELLHL
jgi:hypothetical protein